jgi:2Fe-2S ferredoxin
MMATLRFKGFGEVNVRQGQSVLDAAAKANVPLGSACGGVCACSTCHVHVTAGGAFLSAQSVDEADIIEKAFDVRGTSRLACQARVIREGTIDVEIMRESLEAYENEHPDDRGKFTKAAMPRASGER